MRHDINSKVVTWAHGKLGQQVGRGECWDLIPGAARGRSQIVHHVDSAGECRVYEQHVGPGAIAFEITSWRRGT